jgi:hypothetical protein
MLGFDRFVRRVRVPGLALCILCVGSGCWWQKDSYTKVMEAGFKDFEKRAERERLLGQFFQPAGEFSMWIRPPNPTTLVATPEQFADQFIAWFQGGDPGGPLIEVLLKGSGGAESMAEFQTAAFNSLKAAQKFPPQDPEKTQEPQTITSMHDNTTMTFDLYHGAGKSAGTNVDCQWLLYFGEEQSQKIMVCFIIPDAKYVPGGDFLKAMTMSLESLALASKVAIAQQGGGGGGAGF